MRSCFIKGDILSLFEARPRKKPCVKWNYGKYLHAVALSLEIFNLVGNGLSMEETVGLVWNCENNIVHVPRATKNSAAIKIGSSELVGMDINRALIFVRRPVLSDTLLWLWPLSELDLTFHWENEHTILFGLVTVCLSSPSTGTMGPTLRLSEPVILLWFRCAGEGEEKWHTNSWVGITAAFHSASAYVRRCV
jgi:hypothetical protein